MGIVGGQGQDRDAGQDHEILCKTPAYFYVFHCIDAPWPVLVTV